MQDLGRIVIDINESGGGKVEGESGIAKEIASDAAESAAADGAVEAAAGMSALGAVAEALSTAFAAIGVVVGVTIKAIGKMAEAMKWMHAQVMSFANDIEEFSPQIQLAELDNDLRMMATKFRMGSLVGSQIGGYMREVGALERTLIEIKGLMAGVFASALRPILHGINRLVEWVESYLPAMLEAIGKLFMAMGSPTGSGMFRELYEFGKEVRDIGRNARDIKRNTDPKIDFSDLNKGFLNDLRLMGAKIP